MKTIIPTSETEHLVHASELTDGAVPTIPQPSNVSKGMNEAGLEIPPALLAAWQAKGDDFKPNIFRNSCE